MSIVYVLGAGASFGESLQGSLNPHKRHTALVNPPLGNGFFGRDFLQPLSFDLERLKREFPEAIDYISRTLAIPIEAAERWESIDLETVFTSLELDREFWGEESDYGCRCILARNQLVRSILKLLALCTDDFYGKYARTLVSALGMWDSVLTFNWDLLLDDAFAFFLSQQTIAPSYSAKAGEAQQYNNFLSTTLKGKVHNRREVRQESYGGLFLKLHGSLNWFQCTNRKCPESGEMIFDESDRCLKRFFEQPEACNRCGSTTEPLIIPPLFRKPIADNWIVRSTWGLAHRKLLEAKVAVVVGFSFPPTDFFAHWLLHSTVGLREDVKVFVVNPANGNTEFRARMTQIFPRGFNSDFQYVSQIKEVSEAATQVLLSGYPAKV
jgi:NAD-dependent SIR2 family protein deacetylase